MKETYDKYMVSTLVSSDAFGHTLEYLWSALECVWMPSDAR